MDIFYRIIYSFSFLFIVYCLMSLYKKSFIKIDFKQIFYYMTMFSFLGVFGEVFVNNLYEYFVGEKMWTYHLLPLKNGDISYYFIFIWGFLGIYKYLTDKLFENKSWYKNSFPGVVIALEANMLEIFYNGFYYLIFHGYIFYYTPANLGPLSHLSCLQIIPFYFIFGYCIDGLMKERDFLQNKKRFILTIWFAILIFIFM